MSDGIRGKMARGAVWMILFKALERSLGMISMLVLARLLVPADFGLVAMATSLIGLLELFAAFGLETALIQRAEASVDHYNSAWTLNFLTGASVATLMLVISIPAAHFYSEPRVSAVIWVLAIGALVQGCENVGVVTFRKEMRFDKEFRFLLSKKLITFCITLPLAYFLRNYWALVCGVVIGRFGNVMLSYLVHPFRPRFSLAAAKDLMHFSKWLITQNFIMFLRERSSDLVIGRFAGPHALGIFSVSAEISNMPGTELVAPINRAILPGYVKLANDMPALRREYLSVMSCIALFAVPAVAGFAVCAPFLVLVVLGPKWVEAAQLIQILAFFGITVVMQSNAYSAFLAIGKPQVFVRINAIHVAILLPLLVSLTYFFGITGAALAYVAAGLAILPVTFYFVTRFLQMPQWDLVSHLWRPVVAAALMYVGVRLLGPPLPETAIPELQATISLITCVALGVPLYIAAATLLWVLSGRPDESAEGFVLRQLPHLWRRVRMALP